MSIRSLFVAAIIWLYFALPGRTQEYIAEVQQYGISDGLSHREVNVVAEKFGGPLPAPLDEIGYNWCSDRQKTVYLGTLKNARMISWHPGSGFRIFPLPGYESFKPLAVSAQNTVWGIADGRVWLEVDPSGNILQAHREPVFLSDNRFFLTPDAINYEISSEGQPLCFLQIDKSGRKPLGIYPQRVPG